MAPERTAAFACVNARNEMQSRCVFASNANEKKELLELLDVALRHRFAFPERRARRGDDDDDDESSAHMRKDLKTEKFSFALTKACGTRVIGFVWRSERGDARVALARHPWFEYFWEVLELTDGAMGRGRTGDGVELAKGDALWEFLNRTIGEGMPEAGTSVTVALPWTAFAGVATQSATLYAPDLKREFNSGIKFTNLLDVGHVDAVVALFAALLTERRVVIVGSSAAALSGAVQAANAALYPMSWQHMFLPVLPEPFLDYLTAPMPFLVGLHSSLLSSMRELPCEDIFVLNLDDGSFTYFEEDFEFMPSGPTTLLKIGLLYEVERSRGEDAPAVARVFRTFFSTVLGPYKRHIKGVVAHPPPKDAISADSLWLDHDEFSRVKHGAMLATMRGTQMYEVFVRRRLSMCAVVARKTGFIPVADEIVDFDLEEPDLTISDLMMRGQALSEQFASASSRAYASMKQRASPLLDNWKQSFILRKNKLTASLEKLREKNSSSEDLTNTGRRLSFASLPTQALEDEELIVEEAAQADGDATSAPMVNENDAPAPSAMINMLDLMSFDDDSPAPALASRRDPGADLSLLDL